MRSGRIDVGPGGVFEIMAYVVECEACKTQMTLSETLFERRIAGRQVTLRCKHCQHPVVVDGAALRAGGQNPSRTEQAVPPPTSGPAILPEGGVASAKQQKHYPTLLGFPSVPPPPAIGLVPEPPRSPRPVGAGARELPRPPVGAAAATSPPPRASIPAAAVAPISQVWGDLGKKKPKGSAASTEALVQPPTTAVDSAKKDEEAIEGQVDASSPAAPIEALTAPAVGATQGDSEAETQADPTREMGATSASDTGKCPPRPTAPSSRKLRARPPSIEMASPGAVATPPRLGRPRPNVPGDAPPPETSGAGSAPRPHDPNARPVPPVVPPPLPKRVKTTLGMPLVGGQGRTAAEGPAASERLPPLPIMPPPAPPPRRPDGPEDSPAPPEVPAAANAPEQLSPPSSPTDRAAAREASPVQEPSPNLTPQPAVDPHALDHRQLLDCPVPPTPPLPPAASSSGSRTQPSHEAKSAPATADLTGVSQSHCDAESPDAVGVTEDTTPGFAVGSSDAPSVTRTSRRLRVIGAVAGALAGTAIAAAAFLTLAADDATLASVGGTASQTRTQAGTPENNRAGALPARDAPALVPETAPEEVDTNRAPDAGPGDTPASPTSSGQPPTEVATTTPADEQLPGAETIPANVHAPTVLHRIYLAMQRAENCHKDGRAIGTTMVWFTFPPDGSAPEIRLEGEPIASAPVGNCIREEAKQVRVPKYEGAPFSVKYRLRLR